MPAVSSRAPCCTAPTGTPSRCRRTLPSPATAGSQKGTFPTEGNSWAGFCKGGRSWPGKQASRLCKGLGSRCSQSLGRLQEIVEQLSVAREWSGCFFPVGVCKPFCAGGEWPPGSPCPGSRSAQGRLQPKASGSHWAETWACCQWRESLGSLAGGKEALGTAATPLPSAGASQGAGVEKGREVSLQHCPALPVSRMLLPGSGERRPWAGGPQDLLLAVSSAILRVTEGGGSRPEPSLEDGDPGFLPIALSFFEAGVSPFMSSASFLGSQPCPDTSYAPVATASSLPPKTCDFAQLQNPSLLPKETQLRAQRVTDTWLCNAI
nr:uncharacterized protein LOC129488759 [Symphalangus syndactylus]